MSIRIDQETLNSVRDGTLKDLLWFAWYTLRDNSHSSEHKHQERLAKDLIESARSYKLDQRHISEWNTSHCILILDDLRSRKKLPWIEYDIYQKHFWMLLNILEICEMIDANPLSDWVFNEEARNLYYNQPL